MSRTYRFKKDKWRIKYDRVLEDCYWGYSPRWVRLDPNSEEAKQRLAEFHSDAKKHTMRWNGPSWFHNFYAQRPYRMAAKRELYNFTKYDDYEVLILDKPKRQWYY